MSPFYAQLVILIAVLLIAGLVILLVRARNHTRQRHELLKKFNQDLASQVEEQTVLVKNIMGRLTDGFCSVDQNWNFTYINKTGAQIIGLSQEQLIGHNLWKLFPEAVNYPVYQAYLESFEKQENRQVEFFYDPLGKWIMQHIYPSPSGLSIFFRDTTAIKKAEQELKESEEKYRSMIEQASDGIFILDGAGNYTDINSTGLNMIGYTREEAENLSAFDVMPEGGQLISESRKDDLTAGRSVIVEKKFKRKDGGIRDAEVSFKQLSNGHFLAITRDITAKKQIEEEIRKTNARFQTVSKATSDIVWDWDIVTNTLWWNDNYYTNLGYTKESELLSNDDWYERIHPAERDQVRESITSVLEGEGNSWMGEYSYAKADGTYIRFFDRGFIIRDDAGKPLRAIGSMIDMSPIQTAQKKLIESENRLRTILDTDPECIKLMNPDITLAEINPAGLRMLEVDDFETLHKRPLVSFVAPEQREEVAKLVRDAFEGKEGRAEYEMITYRSTHRWCEINVVPFKNAEGQIVHALGVTRDITERRKAEEALRYNEEKYRTLIEQAVDAIALYDAQGKILDVNTGAAVLLGYTKEELMDMSLQQVLTPEEFDNNPIRYDELQKGNSTVKYRKMNRKNGSVVETEVRSQQLPDGRFLSVIRDLTERIKAEQDLAASYEAIRKLTSHIQDIREEERTNIAREIHDELGQQLTVLKMDVSWLKKKMFDADDATNDKLKDLITMLDQTVRSVRRISSELRPSLLDDLGLVAAIEWQLSEFEKRSGIMTRMVYSGEDIELPDTIKTALFRIFQESLTNVARHSAAENVTVTLTEKEDRLFLSINDNGRGFDKSKIAEKRTLGILGMKERIKMIGGEYEIRGETGRGAEVLVQVPLNQNKSTAL